MNKQEIFDTVVKHLRNQGMKARNHLSCAYRGNRGTSCAVGCLITDEEYTYNMEQNSVHRLYDGDMLPERLVEHIHFLSDLQMVHDSFEVQDWEDQFANLAEAYDLVLPPIAKG